MIELRPLLFATPLLICVNSVMAQETTYDIDIPAQSLSSALDSLARQTDIKPFFNDSLVSGKSSPAVQGRYTSYEALQKLLIGSDLTYKFTSKNAVTINATESGNDEALTLPAVKVVGKGVYDSTDPYNTDYSLPNASTGTKTDTPIMETPFSVQVVPKQVLEDVQAIRPNDALDYVSGVYRAGGSGDFLDASTRRGFNNFPFGDYRDGAPFPVANFVIGGMDLANTERVEALKGPASLLYGMAQPGGVVNYVTKKPLSIPYYSLQQQFGSFDLYRTTVDATGPVNDDKSLLYRFNMAYKSANSFRDFVNSERTFIAPTVTWNISPRTQVNFEFEYDTGHAIFDRGIPAIGNKPANLPKNRFLNEAIPYEYERLMYGINWSHAFNDNWTFSHRFNANYIGQDGATAGGSSLNEATGNLSRFGLVQHQGLGDQPAYFNTINLTGHFDTLGLKHTLLLGGDHYRNTIDTTQKFVFSSINIYNPVYLDPAVAKGSLAAARSLSQSSDWFGLYLQDQIKLPFNFNALAGFRYDSAENSTVNNGVYSANPRSDSLTPRGGLVWQPIPELSLYGSYTENFTAINGQGFAGALLQPETAQQWELGLKTELLNKKFIGTLAWFDLTKQNARMADPSHPGFSASIGEAKSSGLELDLKGEVLPGLNMIGSYSYTPEALVTIGTASQIGQRFTGVPRHGGSLFTTYELQSGTLQGLKFGGGVIVRSSQNTDISATSALLPGYATVNLLSSYSWNVNGKKLTTQLNVNNLLDKDYFPTSNGRNSIEVGAPRTFMGTVRLEY